MMYSKEKEENGQLNKKDLFKLKCSFRLGLPGVPLLAGFSAFQPYCPASRRNLKRDVISRFLEQITMTHALFILEYK